MNVRGVILLVVLHVALAAAILAAGIAAGRAELMGYRAVTLMCPLNLAAAECNRSSALDVIAVIPTPSPFACMMGGMNAGAHAPDLVNGGYLKIVCELR